MTFTEIVTIVQKIIYWILWPLNYIRSLRLSDRVPALNSPLLEMSATQIAKKIRDGEIKSREIVDLYIERIKAVNPIINAVVQDRFNEAKDDANKVDDFISANKGKIENIKTVKPLLGVPFTVKESCALKGMPISVGCVPLKGKVAEEDGEAVSELRKAGAIPLCVTNTPELCVCWECSNLLTGTTRNPYNTNRTAGGSSGGEGAIIGAGASMFGVGSDLGGSIRVPSMFNGIFGHKPTSGINSLKGHFPSSKDVKFLQYCTIGPMARYAEDLPLLMKVLAADRAHKLNLDEKVDLTKLKVYFVEEPTRAWSRVPVAQEIKDRMRDAAEHLKTAYGCPVEEGAFNELENSANIAMAMILSIEGMDNLLDFTKKKEKLNPSIEIIKAVFGRSEFSMAGTVFNHFFHTKMFNKEQYDSYYKQNEDLKARLKDALQDNGVLLYPTFPTPACLHSQIYTVTGAAMYPMIVNALELPATHVPLGLDKNGLPIGVQVIAGPYQDRLCLAVAKALEEKFGGWVPPPTN